MNTSPACPSIIAVTETWCQPGEPDAPYTLPGYTIHRCDLQEARGGGVLLYVRSDLTYRVISTQHMPYFESVWIEIQTHQNPCVVGCLYRPPCSNPRQFCQQLEASLQHFNVMSKNLLLLGDFNAKNAQWLHSDATDLAGDYLSCLLDTYNLTQHVNFATHLVRDTPRSCLDLVITNLTEDKTHVQPSLPLGCCS